MATDVDALCKVLTDERICVTTNTPFYTCTLQKCSETNRFQHWKYGHHLRTMRLIVTRFDLDTK